MARERARAVILVGMVLACWACASALDPSLDISQYAHTSWKVRDGFVKGRILSIAQSPDGYLWLGTESGLYRFDGVRSVPWQPPAGEQLPSNFIQTLLVSRNGTLWIGTFKGLASWKDGKFTRYPELAGVYATALAEDRGGTVWIGTGSSSGGGKLCALKVGKMSCYGAGLFGQAVSALYEDSKGNLWVAAKTGLWRWAPGAPEHHELPRGTTYMRSLIEDDGGALLLTTDKGLKQLAGGKIEDYQAFSRANQLVPLSLLRSKDGSLWIGTVNQGLLHLYGGRVDKFSATDGLSGDGVDGAFEDREGNVWVYTTDGLDRFREFAIPTISRREGIPAGGGTVQASPDGSIWIATPTDVSHWSNNYLTVYRSRIASGQRARTDERDPGSSGRVTEVANSGLEGGPGSLGLDGERLWASTTEGVFYFEAGRFVRVPEIPGGVILIAGDGQGSVWVANTNAGLFDWTPTGAVQQIPWSRFQQTWPRTLAPDPVRGGLWLGFLEGGIAYFKDGQVRASYNAANGLGDGRVTHLRFDSSGALWAATENGLSRIKDGHITTITNKNGLPCSEVHWSMEDDDHAVWLYMPCGLVRIEGSEVDAWVSDSRHVVKATVFDSSDGVRTVGIYGTIGPLVTKSPDGRIWFVPYDGVRVIDPRHLPFNKLPPPVHIEQMSADHQTYNVTSDANEKVHLPPLIREVEIDYTALSLVATEKVLFRYKLEGFDRDWQDAGTRRQAFYSNLPPGNYSFRVKACNNSGVWNEAGALLGFNIAPAYYQTRWFLALCIAGALAGLYLLHLWGERQVAEQVRVRMEERLAERERIARDLHDTLLQSVQGLILKFSGLVKRIPREDPVRQEMDRALDRADEVLSEGRDRVRSLRSSAASSSELPAAFQRVAEETAPSRTATFKTVVEGVARELHPVVLEESFCIGREALVNAFSHSGGDHVEVEITYDSRQFRLRVRDDGRGVDPAVLASGARSDHWGLPGMRERARKIGGRLELWSRPGSGTEVELSVPAATAYQDLGAKSKKGWFRRSSATIGE